jgi:chorismate mutase
MRLEPMSDHTPSLADLRRDIDVLDDQIQDLLRRRAEAVQKVAAGKEAGDGPSAAFLRPGREAQVLRRVLERHHSSLPAAALLRIWREMISSLYRLQGPVQVAVHAPNKSVARWDLARDYYGSTTPMQLCTTATAVMRAISSQPLTLGVMVPPEDGEKEAWWPMLASHSAEAPKVIARLPFVPNPEGRFADLGALVIGPVTPEPSGDDNTLLVLMLAEEAFSMARLSAMLSQAGFTGRTLAQHRGSDGMIRTLVEVDGFVDPGDARLAGLAAAAGDINADAVVIGAYPVPVE